MSRNGEKLFGAWSDAGDPNEMGLREGSAEYHHFLVVGELERGENLERGITHLADLLTFDPGNAQWLAIVDRYVEAMGDRAERALDLGDDRYFATEALRARLVARRGAIAEATSTLVQVSRVKPDVDYLGPWVLRWVEPAGVFESLGERLAKLLLSSAFASLPEHPELTAARLRDAFRYAALAQRLATAYDRDPQTDMTIAGVFRKAGLYDKAIEHARSSPPSWETAMAEGLALRAAGQVDAAEGAFERALGYRPNDVATCLEAGDLFFELARWRRALAWYGRALAVAPGHPWATASACRCRSSAAEAAPELRRLAAEGNERARAILSTGWPYEGYLPRPIDASANLLDQVVGDLGGRPELGRSVSVTLSDVEGPSNRVAYSLGAGIELDVAYQRVAPPDPRQPIETFGFTVWRRDGEILVPAGAGPPPYVADRIAALASEPFSPRRNWAAASRVADNLGPGVAELLLTCVAHPPPVPEGWHVLDWIPRVQLAVAQVLAHLDEAPWEVSVRRRGLYTLLLGPLDWSTEAAIIAVTQLASTHPAIATDVHEALTRLWRSKPASGVVCWEVALHYHWQHVPGLFPDELDEIRDQLDRLLGAG